MSALNNSALIGASGSTGYQISRSVRFRSSASAFFNRTPSVSGSLTTWTWSGWVKRGALATDMQFFTAATSLHSSNPTITLFGFTDLDRFNFYSINNNSLQWNRVSTQVFRDPSSWYHIVVVLDTTNATDANRARVYINGVEITAWATNTMPAQNTAGFVNSSSATHNLGREAVRNRYPFDGYMTEINLIDGQALTPSSFGETNTTTGVWQPKKYAGTYGTNGFYLNFSNPSAATAAAIGADYSGNGNNWTPNNISVTAGVTYDSMIDVPTQFADGGNGRGNYAVSNPLNAASGLTVSDGNLRIAASAGGSKFVNSSITFPSSGAYYAELTFANASTSQIGQTIGIALGSRSLTAAYNAVGSYHFYASNTGSLVSNGTETGGLSAISANEVFQVAVDVTNSKMWLGRSNVWYNATGGTTGNPSTGANQTFTAAFADYFVFAGFDTGSAVSANFNFGQRPFTYTPPTGFKALNTLNLPAPTILKGNQYFDATLYTGNGTSQSVVNSGAMQPDLVWVKNRTQAYNHILADSVRGTGVYLSSSTTDADQSASNAITAFNSNGFSIGSIAGGNFSGNAIVGWQWKANGTPAVTNTAGSITSTVSVGATQGFSIVTYTGNGVTGATVGHGLGVVPEFIIWKRRNATSNWISYNKTSGNGFSLYLDLTNANTASSYLNSTSPNSSVITMSTNTDNNGNGGTYVAYCFASVAGFSAFGSYTGNGSTDGPFVYLGFRPAFVMIKGSSFVSNWFIQDDVRNGYNVNDGVALRPNLSNAEDGTTSYNLDLLSNGFKLRSSAADSNTNGATFIYAAFAENPFKNALAR